MRLGRSGHLGHEVDGPVAPRERRGRHPGTEFDVAVDPLYDRASLRRRSQQTIRDHHEHRVRQTPRTAATADLVEVLVEAETFECHSADGLPVPSLSGSVLHRRHRSEPIRPRNAHRGMLSPVEFKIRHADATACQVRRLRHQPPRLLVFPCSSATIIVNVTPG
jgi:hypothetical protein